VLGHDVNLGAGTKLSNVPVTTGSSAARGHRKIALMIEGTPVDTELRKLGAILGDGVQTGCNAVFNPGALVGPNSLIYPNATVPKGLHDRDIIIKLRQQLEDAKRR
jgi:UDP-N-acetylglucosamine diphosphorylase / glucose-1-phosphate thymidylyltransferase / UDP-N-acetylgalactosamine diphosphorylase / glucosamine-1-phosphate N-acetyltransferase / galactosamine-1-phosphate N-acetyltransferase